MKKLFSIFVVVALLITAVVPAAALEGETDNLLNFFFEKNVDPLYYSGAFMPFVSFSSAGERLYALRSKEDADDIANEISVFLSGFGVTKEETAEYIDGFYNVFADNPDVFELFMSFVQNVNNILLPFTAQPQYMTDMPDITKYISEKLYSNTWCYNLLFAVSNSYEKSNNLKAFYVKNGDMYMRNDTADYISCFENNDNTLKDTTILEIQNIFETVNKADETQKAKFLNYLIGLGIAAADENEADDDKPSESGYDTMFERYKNGTDVLKPCSSAGSIADKFAAQITAADGAEKKELVSEALTEAATIRISDSSQNAVLGADDFDFAVLSAKKAAEILKSKNAYTEAPFEIRVIFENGKKHSLSIPKESLNPEKIGGASSIHLYFADAGELIINPLEFYSSEYLNGPNVTFALEYGEAKTVSPKLYEYAQGGEMLKIDVLAQREITASIAYSAVKYRKDIKGSESDYNTNCIYSVAGNGARENVSNFAAENGYVYFEIGVSRLFAKIDGELREIKKDTTSGGNTGSEGKDDEDIKTPEPSTKPQEPVTKPDDSAEKTETIRFSDVSDSHWASTFIYKLATKKIISGVGDNLFAPDANITREQFAKIIVEAFGLLDSSAECDFNDVANGSWYAPYVASAYKKGIINGMGDNSFGTGQNITRQDMAVMIERTAKCANIELAEPTSHEYNDINSVADYAADAMLRLSSMGIISGFDDNTLRGASNATRAQSAKIICTLMEKK